MLLKYVLITLFVAFLWGLSPIMQKHLLKKFDKFSLMLFFSAIYFGCLLVFLPFYYSHLISDISKIETFDIWLIAFTTITASFLANVILLHVLKYNDSYIVSALTCVSPLFTLLLGYIFFHEKINILGVLGVLLIVLGTFCISLNDASFKMEEFVGFH